MKVKQYAYEVDDNNFTGIREWSDGVEDIGWISVAHYRGMDLHNENGPAIEFFSGNKQWRLDDILYTEDQWKIKIKTFWKERFSSK
jgi:hypothetical protein